MSDDAAAVASCVVEAASPTISAGMGESAADLVDQSLTMSPPQKVSKTPGSTPVKGVIFTTPRRRSSESFRTPPSAKASTSFRNVADADPPTPKSEGAHGAAASSSSSFNSSFKQKQRRFTPPNASNSRGAFKPGPSGHKNQAMRKEHRPHWKPPPAKGKRYGGKRMASGYTLKTKDSLVDVTACLQAKREEVLKLWQSNLQEGNPTLLITIESANRLALEAAEEVEFLRRTIQDFQKKEGGLSDADCQRLEDMRTKVLKKVKEFEEADNTLQKNLDIAKKSTSRTSLVSVSSKKSQTGIEKELNDVTPPLEINSVKVSGFPGLPDASSSGISAKDLVVLKEKPNKFSEESDDGVDVPLQEQPFSDKSTGASGYPSVENLSRLKLLFEENFDFPSYPSVGLGRSQSCNMPSSVGSSHVREQLPYTPKSRGIHNQPQRTVRFNESETSGENVPVEELYREKITYLQRKLMDTEEEVEELKNEIERIESDASFRVRMLQNSVQDKFDSLKAVPDYLQMVDVKLSESVQVKAQLQRELHDKQVLLHDQHEVNKSLKSELHELREKLRTAENTKDFLACKNSELEKSNVLLRNDMEIITKQIADMAGQIQMLKANETMCGSNMTSPRSPRLSFENHKLKLQVAELKDQVTQSKRIIQTLRKSKAKLASDLNDRIEELMGSLQQAQYHKRMLGDQIRVLKKSYNEMFPIELLLAESPINKGGHQTDYKSQQYHQRKPVEEPKLEAKVAWQTGDNIQDFLETQKPIQTGSKTHVSFGGEHEIK